MTPQTSFPRCSGSQPGSLPRPSRLIWISWPEARRHVESPTPRMRFIHFVPDSHQQRTIQRVGGGQRDQHRTWLPVREAELGLGHRGGRPTVFLQLTKVPPLGAAPAAVREQEVGWVWPTGHSLLISSMGGHWKILNRGEMRAALRV